MGTLIASWPLALLVSTGLHIILDVMPHVDAATLKPSRERGSMNLTDLTLAFLDLLIGLGILILLNQLDRLSPSVFAGVIGGVLPDLPGGLYSLYPTIKRHSILGWFYHFNRRIQGTVDKKGWILGTVTTIFTIAVALTVILRSF